MTISYNEKIIQHRQMDLSEKNAKESADYEL